MVFNQKVAIVGGGVVTLGLAVVLGLVVMRAQSPKPTVTRSQAGDCPSGCSAPLPGSEACKSECSGCAACQGSSKSPSDEGGSWIEGCKYKYDTADSSKCWENPASGPSVRVYDKNGTAVSEDKRNGFSTGPILTSGESYKVVVDKFPDYYHWPWRANVCLGKHLCFSGGKSYCSDKVGGQQPTGITCEGATSTPTVINSNEVTIKVPDSGASSAIGFEVYNENTPPNNFTAISPINGATVNSLTPTFSWNSDGVAYQVICVGSYADGHPPGSCNFVNCTADFGPSVTSYTTTSSLLPNTDYRWLVYGQPGNPAPTTGCQSFKTGAGCSSGQTLCGSSCVNLQTDNNNCGACGAKCSSGQSCSAGACTGNVTCTTNANCPGTLPYCVGGVCSAVNCSLSVVAPKLAAPADRATEIETRPTFQWDFGQDKACTSGLTYRLYSGTSASNVALFERAVVPGTQCAGPSGAACSFTPTAAASLQNGTKYYWKVQALRGSDSAAADSSIQSFTTGGSNQMNTCWGNGGADGTCVDCNGDGVINVLDFSCFASLYAKPVQ